MTEFLAPALDGRDPLGFLAALGTVRLLAEQADDAAALAFDPDTGQARFTVNGVTSLDEAVAALQSTFDALGESVVPGMPADFPPPGAAPDQLRVPPEELRILLAGWADRAPSATVHRWVRALVTDVSLDRSNRTVITPFAAPSGKQSFSTMFVGAKQAVASRPSALREALTGWRRVPGYTGEYLDHRVLMSSADAPSKADVRERGVPGATWLALMALPMFPVTGANGLRAAAGWRSVGRSREWRWPMWRRPYGLRPIEVLLNHPALFRVRAASAEGNSGRSRAASAVAEAQLRRLAVFMINVAERRGITGRKSDGVLVLRDAIAVTSTSRS